MCNTLYWVLAVFLCGLSSNVQAIELSFDDQLILPVERVSYVYDGDTFWADIAGSSPYFCLDVR